MSQPNVPCLFIYAKYRIYNKEIKGFDMQSRGEGGGGLSCLYTGDFIKKVPQLPVCALGIDR